MSSLLSVIQAVVRDELSGWRSLELGTVTEVFTNAGGQSDHNLECSVRLRGSGLEVMGVPVAVARPGVSAVPRVGDLVVLGFVGGDLNGPVVLGALHDEESRAPDGQPDEVVYTVPDDGGERRLEIQLPNDNLITVTDSAVSITYGGTSFDLRSDGDVTIEAAGNLTLKAGQAVSIEAGTELTAKAITAAIEASAEAKLKGAMTSIAGVTQFSSS